MFAFSIKEKQSRWFCGRKTLVSNGKRKSGKEFSEVGEKETQGRLKRCLDVRVKLSAKTAVPASSFSFKRPMHLYVF